MSNDDYSPLHVGDKVKGVSSGHVGTVMHVYDDGRITAVKDDETLGYWSPRMRRERFFLVERRSGPSASEPKFKVGDKVRGKGAYATRDYEVLHVSPDSNWLWLKTPDNTAPFTADALDYEKNDFFVAGRKYKRGPGWQIFFQRNGMVEFQVVRVDEESGPMKVAYGKLTLVETGETRWVTHKGRYEYGQWEQA